MGLVRDFATSLGTRVITVTFGLATSIVVARSLQPDGKGAYALLITTIQLVSGLGALGVGKSVVYYLGKSRNNEIEGMNRRSIAGNVVTVGLLAGLGAGLVASAICYAAVTGYGIPVSSQVYPVTGLAVFFVIQTAILEGLLRGEQHIQDCNIIQLTQSIGYLLAISLTFSVFGAKPSLALDAYLVMVIGAALVALTLARRRGFELTPLISFTVIRCMLTYGLVLQLCKLVVLFHQKLDVYLVRYFADEAQVGYFTTGVGLAAFLANLPSVMGYVLVPWVARRSRAEAAVGTAAASRVVLAMTIPAALCLGVLGSIAIELAYGASYLPAVEPLRWVLPGVVMSALYWPASAYLLGQGELRPILVIHSITLAANIALNWWLIPLWGITGAALASSLTYSIASLSIVWYISKTNNIPLVDFFLIKRGDLVRIKARLKRRSRKGTVDD